jgi:flagellar biosynthesis/type III secretory pathway protein FliH
MQRQQASMSRLVVSPNACEPLFPAARLLKGAVLDAERTAREARAEAEAARRDAELTRTRAREQGRAEGLAEARVLLEDLARQIGAWRASVATELAETALYVARTVLNTELRASSDAVAGMALAAARRARFCSKLVVCAHPDDLAAIRVRAGEFAGEAPQAESIEFRADPTLPRFRVRIDTETGAYEAGPEVRLEAVRREMGLPATAPPQPQSPQPPEAAP